ncbi:MAG: ABC transporter substrate-binding protein [Rhodospirillales bacterium]|nr:ABC transporter substrate-binding protein [Rhodospirillales bacterium]
MRHRTAIAIAATIVSVGIGSHAFARDLTVVSWGGNYQEAQRKAYFEPFMKATGIKLIEDSWDGGIGTLRAKVQGGDVAWDVVQAEAEELQLGCDEGVILQLDWEKLGGKDNFLPTAVHDCGVGAILWSTVLAYDGSKFPNGGPTSWADFWDVDKFPGKRALRKGPKYNLEFALMADGVAPADVYATLATADGVQRAFDKLSELKDHLIWWEAGAQPPQLLASGEVVMTSVYNGRLDTPRKEGKDFRIVWPGSIYAIDSWVILKGSPNVGKAMELIAFMSAPENQKNLPPYISYGVTHKDAVNGIAPDVLSNLPSAPDNLKDAIAIDTGFWTDNIDELNKRFNAWAAQ